jgi:uncharacterized protein
MFDYMKNFRHILFTLALLAVTAQASDKLLNSLQPRGLVSDYANVISAAEENKLLAILTELQQKTGAEVAVVTLPSLDGGQIDDFSIRLAERWGIGQKGSDNGILLLGATQEGRGNRMRIEVGYGLEGVINDALAGRILDQYVVPLWNQRQYGAAFVNGGAAIAQRIAADKGIRLSGVPQYTASRGYNPQPQRKSNPIVTFIFILGFIYMAIRHPRLLILLMLTSGRGGGSRGGGGFGGGGFGGGGFGGGGASR